MKISRRNAIIGTGGLVAATGLATALWTGGDDSPNSSMAGADVARGHRLRDGRFPEPVLSETAAIAIIGGGVGGLSAAWALSEAGCDEFLLLELEGNVGGNARSGANAVSRFPLGAHYLPLPNREAGALVRMLDQLGMITGRDAAGAPRYDPFQLCADLEERIFWQGRWHEGLVPQTGLDGRDSADIEAFFAAMEQFKSAVGSDGRPAFATPMAYSSADPRFAGLDAASFAHWVAQQGWRSPVLLTHLRYCCRDDYGCEPGDVSAWAGIHYFAGRRAWAADDVGDAVLTWPEGNARLTDALADQCATQTRIGRIAWRIAETGDGVAIDSFDIARGESVRTTARAAILALPHFVATRIAPGLIGNSDGFSYAPWLVANVTLDHVPGGRGSALAWDNVPFVGESLGYVVATHQDRANSGGPTVVTWYMPLSRGDPAEQRRTLLARPATHWRDMVVEDLLRTNPELSGAIRDVAIWRWGHAMIRPTPGFITRTAPSAHSAVRPPLFLAHSDISGLSLFEEAHYRGVASAEGAMRHIRHQFETML